MEKLQLKDCGLITARPTCGKSALCANDDENVILDTDWITFGLIGRQLRGETHEIFLEDHKRAGSPACQFKSHIERVLRFFMQFDVRINGDPVIWISNLSLNVELLNRIERKKLWVTRQPDAAWEIFLRRTEALGKEPRIKEDAFKRWFDVPSYAKLYDEVIVLEDHEFLCDVFGITPKILDPVAIEEACYEDFKHNFAMPAFVPDQREPLFSKEGKRPRKVSKPAASEDASEKSSDDRKEVVDE